MKKYLYILLPLGILINNSYADFKISDTYCNENYSIKPWEEKKKGATSMKYFFENAPDEAARIISILNNLPVINSSNTLLREMNTPPSKKQEIMKLTTYRWKFETDHDHLFVNVSYWKGCLNRIELSYAKKPYSYDGLALYWKTIELSKTP